MALCECACGSAVRASRIPGRSSFGLSLMMDVREKQAIFGLMVILKKPRHVVSSVPPRIRAVVLDAIVEP
jgi:hypothetical protein